MTVWAWRVKERTARLAIIGLFLQISYFLFVNLKISSSVGDVVHAIDHTWVFFVACQMDTTPILVICLRFRPVGGALDQLHSIITRIFGEPLQV